jgi:hypothetical protein
MNHILGDGIIVARNGITIRNNTLPVWTPNESPVKSPVTLPVTLPVTIPGDIPDEISDDAADRRNRLSECNESAKRMIGCNLVSPRDEKIAECATWIRDCQLFFIDFDSTKPVSCGTDARYDALVLGTEIESIKLRRARLIEGIVLIAIQNLEATDLDTIVQAQ